jgi:hypothetical protein
MKFIAIPTANLLAATSSATAIGSAYGNAFESHSIKSMDGECTSDGRCKVPEGVYVPSACWNSECRPQGKEHFCIIGVGFHGWIAKCPKNNLPYELVWPWVPPKKDGRD